MSNVIEENVVKMRFDNSDFDSNIEKSTESLDDFKKTLSSLPNEVNDTTSVLEKLVSNISLVDILNFAAIHSAIDDVKGDFLSIPDVVKGVAEECEALFTKITGINVMSQIAEGGNRRAQNIEQAMFMLKGLNLDTKTFMDAANYAVKGTAYGLDSAVKVAAQLGASGMTVEEDLKQALRGISGVAAMTNSTYDEIGRIFTFAASYGKVTSRQLLMLSTRGINATAAMAKQMGKTEQEVRAMMSKGQVTFKDFAKAMDDAFGEHSKKANETFSGSMMNVKAALSRIGADAFTPWRESMIKVYNQLQGMFDAIKAGIKSSGFYDSWTEFLNKITPTFTNIIQWIGEAYEKSRLLPEAMAAINAGFDFFANIVTNIIHINWGGWITKGFNTVANALRVVNILMVNFAAMFQEIIGPRVKKIFDSFVLGFSSLSEAFAFTEEDLASLNEVFGSWFKVLEQVLDAITEIFGTFDRFKLRDKIKDLAKNSLDFIKKLKASDTTIDKFRRVFTGAASALDIVRMLIVKIFDIVKPAGQYLGPIADKVLTIAARVGDMFKNLRDTIKANDSFSIFFEKVFNILTKIKTLITGIGTNFFEAFFGDTEEGTTFVDRIFDFISRIGQVVGDAFSNIHLSSIDLTPLKNFVMQIYNLGFPESETEEAEEKIEKATTFLDVLKDLISKIKKLLFGGEAEEIAEETTGDKSILDVIYDKFIGLLDWIKGLAEEIASNSDMGDVALMIGGILGSLALVISAIADVFAAFAKVIGAVAVLVGTDAVGKAINTLAKKKGATPISTIVDGFTNIATQVKDVIKSFEDVGILGLIAGGKAKATTFAQAVWAVVFLIGTITASLLLLSMVPVEDLNKSVGALAAVGGILLGMLIAMGIISSAFKLFNKTSAVKDGNIIQMFRDPMKNLGIALDILAFGLVEIAAALLILSKTGITGKEMLGYAGILGLCILALSAIFVGFAFLEEKIAVLPSDFMWLAGAMAIASLAILAISAAISIIVDSTKGVNSGRIWLAFGVSSLMLLVMGVILGALANLSISEDLLITAASMVVMSAAIALIMKAISDTILVINKSGMTKERLHDIVEEIITVSVIVGLFGVILGLIGALPGINLMEVGALLAGFGVLLLGISALLTPASLALDAFTRFVQMLFEFLDVDSSNYEEKLVSFIKAMGRGLGEGLVEFNKALFKDIDIVTVKLFNYLRNTFLPSWINFTNSITPQMVAATLSNIELIFNTLTKYAPDAMDAIGRFVYGVLFGFKNSEGDGIIETIFDWIDEFNDNMTVRIIANIPKWVAAAYLIIMGFVTAIRTTLEENQETIETELRALLDVITAISQNVLGSEENKLSIKAAIKGLLVNIIVGALEMLEWIAESMKTIALYVVASFMMGIITGGREFGLNKDWLIKALLGDEDNLDLEVDVTPVINWDDADTSGYGYLSTVGSSAFTSGYNTSGVYGSNNSAANSMADARNQYELLAGDIGKEVAGAISDSNKNYQINIGLEPDSQGLLKIVNQSFSELQGAGMMDNFGQLSFGQ